MKQSIIICFFIQFFLLSGCSTMFNSGSQSMMIRGQNDEENIKVQVQTDAGTYSTDLPATVSSEPSNEGVRVTVVDECYDRTITKVNTHVTPSYWANLLNGWGFLIDFATGKMWKYEKNTFVILNKKDNCSS